MKALKTFYSRKAGLHIAVNKTEDTPEKVVQFVPIEGSAYGKFETDDKQLAALLEARADIIGPEEFETLAFPDLAREIIATLRADLAAAEALIARLKGGCEAVVETSKPAKKDK